MSIRYLSGINVDANTLFVDSTNDRVGIGTGSPVSPLDVNGIISSRGIFIAQNSGTYNLLYNASNSVSMYLGGSADPGNYYDNTTHYFRSSGGGTTYAVINYLGNVGIGTTSPAEILHLFREVHSGDVQLRVENNGYLAGTKSTLLLKSKGTNGNPVDASISNVQEGTTAGALAFYTGGANERLRIASTGNVGIGTTSPSQKLTVSGSTGDILGITNGTTIGYGYVDNNGFGLFTSSGAGGTGIYYRTANIIDHYVNGSIAMRLNSTGNVGIGTTSPATKLDVIGVGAFGTMTSSRGTYSNGLSLQNNTGEATSLFLWQSGVASAHIGSPANSTSLHIVNSYNTGLITDPNSIVLTNTGNVGIGTTSPAQKLHVVGNTTITGVTYTDVVQTYSGASIDFRHQDASVVMRVDTANARVGIGTTAPSEKLQVSGNISITSQTGTKIGFNTTDSFTAYGYSVAHYGISFPYGQASVPLALSGYYGLGLFTEGFERIRVLGNGNVGIGTTSPAAKLDVAGDIRLGGTATYNSVSVYNNGASGGGGYLAYQNGVANAYFGAAGWYIGNSDTGAVIGTDSSSRPIRFYTNTERMRITGAGDVGIGTTSPSNTKLAIQADWVSGHSTVKVYPTTAIASGGLAGYGIFDSNGSTRLAYIAATSSDFQIWGQLNAPMTFGTNDTERLRITATGNVGIGTTNPANRLQIGSVGSSGFGGNDIVIGNGTQVMAFYQSSTVSTWYTNTNFALMPSGAGATGNLGVGTDTPTQRVHVSGNIRVTGAYYDSNNSAGSSGQVLSSTGSGTDWVSLSEITGVDGTGTANYIAKWSDTDTITNSSITDNGSTVTANVDRLNMNKQAGIYTFSKTLGATVASDFFSISNNHGAQAFRVTFVCSSSGYSVAKTYEVVHAYGQTPIYFKVVDTGPYGSEDFDVAFTDSNSSTGVKATVTNNSATTAANIVATVFLGGGFETITVTAL